MQHLSNIQPVSKCFAVILWGLVSTTPFAGNPVSQNYVDLRAAGLQSQITAIQNAPALTLKVGDCYLGGVIFYSDSNTRQGLVSALSDASPTTMHWANAIDVTTAVGLRLFTGKDNTNALLLPSSTQYPPATAAYNYQGINQTDPPGTWYLPSRDALVMMWDILGSPAVAPSCEGWVTFQENIYWSSSEYTSNNGTQAWGVAFNINNANTGTVSNYLKLGDSGYVRAARSFTY